MPDTAPLSAQDATTLLDAFASAWRDRDMTALAGLMTEDVIYRASVGPEPGRTWRGRDSVLAGIAQMMASETGSVRTGPAHVSADGQSVTAIWYHMDGPDGAVLPREIGCDIFRLRGGRIAEKDAYRKVRAQSGRPLTAPPGDPACRTAPYHRRYFRPAAAWHVDGFHVKPYLISQGPDGVGSDLQAMAREEIARRVADARDLGGHRDSGYAIVHRGTDAIWLLFNWWAFGEIVCQTMSYAQPGDSAFERLAETRLKSCVWESEVVEFERQAWKACMLTDAPDLDLYRSSVMSEGWY